MGMAEASDIMSAGCELIMEHGWCSVLTQISWGNRSRTHASKVVGIGVDGSHAGLGSVQPPGNHGGIQPIQVILRSAVGTIRNGVSLGSVMMVATPPRHGPTNLVPPGFPNVVDAFGW